MWGSRGPLPRPQAWSPSPALEASSTEPHVWFWLLCGPQPGKLASRLTQSGVLLAPSLQGGATRLGTGLGTFFWPSSSFLDFFGLLAAPPAHRAALRLY